MTGAPRRYGIETLAISFERLKARDAVALPSDDRATAFPGPWGSPGPLIS